MGKIRLTVENIGNLLRKNEGFTTSRYSSGKGYWTESHFRISDGKLFRQMEGKDSVNGRFNDSEEECSIDDTRRILRSILDELDLDI